MSRASEIFQHVPHPHLPEVNSLRNDQLCHQSRKLAVAAGSSRLIGTVGLVTTGLGLFVGGGDIMAIGGAATATTSGFLSEAFSNRRKKMVEEAGHRNGLRIVTLFSRK